MVARIEAHTCQPELVLDAIEFAQARVAIERLDDTNRGREKPGVGVAVRGNGIVDGARVGRPFGRR